MSDSAKRYLASFESSEGIEECVGRFPSPQMALSVMKRAGLRNGSWYQIIDLTTMTAVECPR